MEQFKTNIFFSCKRYLIEQIKRNYVNLISFLSQVLYVCMHVCVCICMCFCVCVCLYDHICAHMCGGQRSISGILLYQSPP